MPATLMRAAENRGSPSRIATSQPHGQRHVRAVPRKRHGRGCCD